MTVASLLPTVGIAAASVFAGVLFGLLYFAGLRRAVECYVGSGNAGRALAFTLARIGGVVAFLTIAAWLGALPLLAAFAGFLAARAIVLRRPWESA
jgi:hypothetical protein